MEEAARPVVTPSVPFTAVPSIPIASASVPLAFGQPEGMTSYVTTATLSSQHPIYAASAEGLANGGLITSAHAMAPVYDAGDGSRPYPMAGSPLSPLDDRGNPNTKKNAWTAIGFVAMAVRPPPRPSSRLPAPPSSPRRSLSSNETSTSSAHSPIAYLPAPITGVDRVRQRRPDLRVLLRLGLFGRRQVRLRRLLPRKPELNKLRHTSTHPLREAPHWMRRQPCVHNAPYPLLPSPPRSSARQ